MRKTCKESLKRAKIRNKAKSKEGVLLLQLLENPVQRRLH